VHLGGGVDASFARCAVDSDSSGSDSGSSSASASGRAAHSGVASELHAARAARVLLEATAALPRPPALRLHLGLRLVPRGVLAASLPRVRHLTVANYQTAAELCVLVGSESPLLAVTSLAWSGDTRSVRPRETAPELDDSAAAAAILLATLQALPALRSLRITHMSILGPASRLALCLALVTALTPLDLSRYAISKPYSAHIDVLTGALTQLRALRALHVPEIQGTLPPVQEHLAALARLPRLTQLGLCWRPLGTTNDEWVRSWWVFAGLRALRRLTVGGHMNRDSLVEQRRRLPQVAALTRLALRNVNVLTSARARALFECPQLRGLTLHNSEMTADAMSMLTAAAAQVTALSRLRIHSDTALAQWHAANVAVLVARLAALRSVCLWGQDSYGGRAA
jgi:hypothetical protein